MLKALVNISGNVILFTYLNFQKTGKFDFACLSRAFVCFKVIMHRNKNQSNQINVRLKKSIFGLFIDAVSWNETISQIRNWSLKGESRYVCICNVHSIVTGNQSIEFANILNKADMATPDGAPIAWMLRRLGFKNQQRINGPDLLEKYCAQAEISKEKIFFYGSSELTLEKLKIKLIKKFPELNIAGMVSPPYRSLDLEEREDYIKLINKTGATVIFVSLGCPKQEMWMASHKGRINGVMIGVGAAFDYHAETIKRAPKWMQDHGFEWAHRLASEPRRLWKRYFLTNSLFIYLATRELVFGKKTESRLVKFVTRYFRI